MRTFRFAVAGAGVIAHKFVDGLSALPGAELAGVASHTPGRAEEFVNEYSCLYPRAAVYHSYQELAQDSSIDAVYIANMNTQHAETAMLFLSNKIPVICEKPFALNAGQAKDMIECARAHDTFLMEAMWTRFHPVTRKAADWIRTGKIGEIVSVKANFGMDVLTSLNGRTAAIDKGGGALLDLGVYPISYLSMIFGHPPVEMKSIVSKVSTGVDASFDALLKYGELDRPLSQIHQIAHLSVAMDRTLSQTIEITGTGGVICIHDFWASDSACLTTRASAEVYSPGWIPNGYQYEAQEVMNMVTAGKKESSIMPLSETISIMETLDAMRNQWGLVFSQEK